MPRLDPAPPEYLLPAAFRSPWLLVGAGVLPLLALLALNLHGWRLAGGEMSAAQQGRYGLLLLAQSGLLLAYAGTAAGLRRKGRPVGAAAHLALLPLPILYLWLATASVDMVLPSTVTLWILPADRWLGHQYTLVMPILFVSAFALACAPLRLSTGRQTALAALGTVGVPLGWYLGTRLFDLWRFSLLREILFLLLVATTLLLALCFLRLVALLFRKVVRSGDHGMLVFTLLVGLIGPLAGLLLNRSIPFPVDLQSPGLYALTVVNGLVLMLPRLAHAGWNRLIWLLQATTFPFTAYFFLVFLPWLPLSLPAMLVLGAGFLIWVPTALALVHGLRLGEGCREAARGWGPLRAGIALALALLLLPAAYLARATLHRGVLHRAIAYVFEGDPVRDLEFPGSRGLLRRSLINLKAYYDGVEYPYLTGLYSRIVFGGLILPKEKIDRIHRVFFGGDTPATPSGEFTGLLRATNRSRTGFLSDVFPGRPPPAEVRLAAVDWIDHGASNGVRAVTARLSMLNPLREQAEFVTRLDLPPGVLITGYWLHIGAERVPGRLFERKTAQWVYQMIRDTERRDPGLLVYLHDRQVELRVFPFEAEQTRHTEITFQFPDGARPELRIGDRSWRGEKAARPTLCAVPGHGWGLSLPGADTLALPETPRTPELHLLLDGSAACTVPLRAQVESLRRRLPTLPGETPVRLGVVRDGYFPLTPTPVSLAELPSWSPPPDFPRAGGLFLERALDCVLLDWRGRCTDPVQAGESARRVPWVLAFLGKASLAVDGDPGENLATRFPGAVIVRHREGDPETPAAAFTDPAAAVLVRVGPQVWPVPRVGPPPHAVLLPGDGRGAALEVWEPARQTFTPLPGLEVLPADSPYAQALGVWLDALQADLRPAATTAARPERVRAARAASVLTPETAWIVVENSAQWAILEEKERQKLGQQDALEFLDAPLPTVWIVGGFLLYLGWRRACGRR
jgi:hypothetical protein